MTHSVIISQTLLLPNDLGIKTCKSLRTRDGHRCSEANHTNACSFTGGVAVRHHQAKFALERAIHAVGLIYQNEKLLALDGTGFRADIYVHQEVCFSKISLSTIIDYFRALCS